MFVTKTTARNVAKPHGERERLRKVNARRAAGERDVVLDPVVNPERKAACEHDVFRFLQEYLPQRFYHPFTTGQRQMAEAICHRFRYGGCQAIAAPRGEGKTTLASFIALHALLYGHARFVLLVAANAIKAQQILRNIKAELTKNDRLHEDFREVTALARYVGGASQRAGTATVEGADVHMVWKTDHVIFPDVEGSKASGGILFCAGATSSNLRGLNVEGVRPDLVIIEDIDSRESAESDEQTGQKERIIEEDLAGVGGPGKKVAMVMLCTCINRKCIAYTYTDPKRKPAWNGIRQRLLLAMPEREDLWAEYTARRLAGMETGQDPDGRDAHAYYLEHRTEMDAGAQVANPHRFNGATLPDGSQAEASALEAIYNQIADRSKDGQDGWNHFAIEFQNDPPEPEGLTVSGLTPALVASRVTTLAHRAIPEGTRFLTAGVDLGKWGHHWVVAAWRDQFIGAIIDYGIAETYGAEKGRQHEEAIERAVLNALFRLRDEWQATPYQFDDGTLKPIDMALVDSATWTTTAYEFTRTVGKPFHPARGFGDGPSAPSFHAGKPANGKVVGTGWYREHKPEHRINLVGLDSNHWKQFAQQRFLTPTYGDDHGIRPGTLSLFCPDDDARRHHTYSHHVCAEQWTEEFTSRGMKRGFVRKNPNNHYLDATYMATAAAEILGIRIVGDTKTRKYVALGELARRAER